MFWFWGVLVPAVVQMVAQVPFESGDPWFMFTYGSAAVVAVVFWVVGTWRSATKYRSRLGGWRRRSTSSEGSWWLSSFWDWAWGQHEEMTEALAAGRGERTPDRLGYRDQGDRQA